MKTAVRLMVVITAGVLGFASSVQAQEKFRVGVVDARKVLLESKPGIQYRNTMEKMLKERQEKLGKDEAKIKQLRDDLEKNSLVLSDAQKEQKRKEIDERTKALREASRNAEEELKKRDAEMLRQANKILQGIVDEIARQEKVAMVIDRSQAGVLWVQEDVDLTDKVIKAYEAKAAK